MDASVAESAPSNSFEALASSPPSPSHSLHSPRLRLRASAEWVTELVRVQKRYRVACGLHDTELRIATRWRQVEEGDEATAAGIVVRVLIGEDESEAFGMKDAKLTIAAQGSPIQSSQEAAEGGSCGAKTASVRSGGDGRRLWVH